MKIIQRFLLRLLLLALLVLAVILGVRYLTTGKGIKSLFGFSRLYLIISNRLSPYFSKTDEAD